MIKYKAADDKFREFWIIESWKFMGFKSNLRVFIVGEGNKWIIRLLKLNRALETIQRIGKSKSIIGIRITPSIFNFIDNQQIFNKQALAVSFLCNLDFLLNQC